MSTRKTYNASELAALLGCNASDVVAAIKSGWLKGYKSSGKWRIKKDQEVAFQELRANKQRNDKERLQAVHRQRAETLSELKQRAFDDMRVASNEKRENMKELYMTICKMYAFEVELSKSNDMHLLKLNYDDVMYDYYYYCFQEPLVKPKTKKRGKHRRRIKYTSEQLEEMTKEAIQRQEYLESIDTIQEWKSLIPRIRVVQERTKREKEMAERGPKAKIIYTPAGGSSKYKRK